MNNKAKDETISAIALFGSMILSTTTKENWSMWFFTGMSVLFLIMFLRNRYKF